MSDDIQELKALIQLMNDNDLLELEVTTKEGKKIRLKKKYEGVRKEIVAMPGGMPAAFPEGMATGGKPAPATDEATDTDGLEVVRSPMVGTFYRRANPESESYVEVGTEIKEGTVLCLIEAMKVFNEIKSPVAGEVVKILASDSEPVEYNQPLFYIRPA